MLDNVFTRRNAVGNLSQDLLFSPDNTYKVGDTGARPKSVQVGPGSTGTPSLIVGNVGDGFYNDGTMRYAIGGGDAYLLGQTAFTLNNSQLLKWGATASFPALKRSSAILQSRLADDSGFTRLQAILRTHQAAVAETITPDHTIVIEDSAGTAWRVPCQV